MINYKHAAVIYDLYFKMSTGADFSVDAIERHHKISHKFFEVIRDLGDIKNIGLRGKGAKYSWEGEAPDEAFVIKATHLFEEKNREINSRYKHNGKKEIVDILLSLSDVDFEKIRAYRNNLNSK